MKSNRDGNIINTGMTMLEVRTLEPKTAYEMEETERKGPIVNIIYTLDKAEEATAKREQLMRDHNNKVRIRMIPSRNEFEAIVAGHFEIEEEHTNEG